MTRQDRFRGALLGLAAGDAVGTTVEFSPPGTFAPLTGMTGGGPFHLPAGAWTDDTSMATRSRPRARAPRTGAPEAADACRYFALLLVAALNDDEAPEPPADLHAKIAVVARGSYRTNPHIRGTGYVVDALEAALWAVHTTGSFEAAILAAANLGDDADTTAAIAGRLRGARYGVDAIPAGGREKIVSRDEIIALADRLMP